MRMTPLTVNPKSAGLDRVDVGRLSLDHDRGISIHHHSSGE